MVHSNGNNREIDLEMSAASALFALSRYASGTGFIILAHAIRMAYHAVSIATHSYNPALRFSVAERRAVYRVLAEALKAAAPLDSDRERERPLAEYERAEEYRREAYEILISLSSPSTPLD